MRHFCWLTRWEYSLTVAIGLLLALTPTLQAEAAEEADQKDQIQQEADGEKEQPQQDEPQAEAPKEQPAPAPRKVVIKKRAPLYELPMLRPKQLIKSVPRLAPQPAPEPAVKQKPAPKQLPANVRPNLPFWQPRQRGLSAAATYQLNSLGRHVHLNPATRFHLNRANGGMTIPSDQQISPAAVATGQGAEKFYPGVSRLPAEKPFANIQPEPTGLQRYWPLLLEGREDPNTGLIIWTLP
ncbi:MAG: hypothetical protein ACR2NM_17825 [Bythopirellula sp.]